MAASENQNPTKPELPNFLRSEKEVQLFFETPVSIFFLADQYDELAVMPLYTSFFLPDTPVSGVFRPPSV